MSLSQEIVVLSDDEGVYAPFRPKYDDRHRQLIANMIEQGLQTAKIARELRITLKTVRLYRRKIRTFGTVFPGRVCQLGRPRKSNVAIDEAILEFISAQDQSPYLDEIQLFLEYEHDLKLSLPTISRSIKRSKWSHKKGDKVHPARDEEQRIVFRSRMLAYRASQLVVVDESAVDPRNGDRRWGFSPIGVAYKLKQIALRSKHWSILPALGINGYLEYEIYEGSFDTIRFANFVRKLLCKMEPYPGPRSVLVLDNCSTHHSQLVKDLCQQAGVRFEPLPPYSPDFSPIELSFSKLKAWIKRNRSLLVADPSLKKNFHEFLHLAIIGSDAGSDARNWFKKCHWIVNDDDIDVDYLELHSH